MAQDDKTEKDETEKAELSASEEGRDSTPSDPGHEESGAPVVASAAPAANGHAAAHGHDDDHGLAHVLPVPFLLGVLFALLLLTVLTVSVTYVDLGHQGNLVVAMLVATVKASLVVAFFMHLAWDNKFHFLLFLSSVLFVILFLALATTDRGEYQHDLDYFTQQQEASQ